VSPVTKPAIWYFDIISPFAHLALSKLDDIRAYRPVELKPIVFGGVLERHPGLDVCISHGGGAAAFVSGRFARAVEKRPWASKPLRDNGFDHYYKRI